MGGEKHCQLLKRRPCSEIHQGATLRVANLAMSRGRLLQRCTAGAFPFGDRGDPLTDPHANDSPAAIPGICGGGHDPATLARVVRIPSPDRSCVADYPLPLARRSGPHLHRAEGAHRGNNHGPCAPAERGPVFLMLLLAGPRQVPVAQLLSDRTVGHGSIRLEHDRHIPGRRDPDPPAGRLLQCLVVLDQQRQGVEALAELVELTLATCPRCFEGRH